MYWRKNLCTGLSSFSIVMGILLVGMVKTHGSSASASRPRATRQEKGKAKVIEGGNEVEPEARKWRRVIYESTIATRGTTRERMVDRNSLGKSVLMWQIMGHGLDFFFKSMTGYIAVSFIVA
ncbi:unnamed protein product [Ilex paraguariensis]|uniref:Uncharacterized protein n=1 Tax=Ilex paraguariensis TaxID=185542 RepID=A0ABC8U2M2_9AQUA